MNTDEIQADLLALRVLSFNSGRTSPEWLSMAAQVGANSDPNIPVSERRFQEKLVDWLKDEMVVRTREGDKFVYSITQYGKREISRLNRLLNSIRGNEELKSAARRVIDGNLGDPEFVRWLAVMQAIHGIQNWMTRTAPFDSWIMSVTMDAVSSAQKKEENET